MTHAELNYEGSLSIDTILMQAASILPFEQLHVYNVSNGERFTTYAIEDEAGSGTIGVNGAAAHKASPADLLIICTYALMPARDAKSFQPRLVYLSPKNSITKQSKGELLA